jgi:hypothetical protein
VLYASGDV